MQTVALLENFVDNVRSACDERGLTQRELANRSGVHYVTVSKLLAGKVTNPSLDVCERIAAAAGLNPALAFVAPEKPKPRRRVAEKSIAN